MRRRRPRSVSRPSLTVRQLQVVRLVTIGLPNREIGRQLGISEACVKFHLGSLFRHYGVDNRVSVVVRAIADGVAVTTDGSSGSSTSVGS
jgi:DNA-binding NarL/FixJ family response regulator